MSDYRETPTRLSHVGKVVRLSADVSEGWPEEEMRVTDDYEWKKSHGFERFLRGYLLDGAYTEVPYCQFKEEVE